MAENESGFAEPDLVEAEDRPPRRRRRRIMLAIIVVLAIALALTWLSRNRLADDYLADQLESLGLPATYEIESIGPRREVLRNVVVGDPRRPDLTIERLTVSVRLGWSGPALGKVTLEKPRLHGSYRNGKASFGSLDKVLFTGGEERFRLPDLDLALVDGRALIESDYGSIGLKADGAGHLRSGFAGIIAAAAPKLAASGCTVVGGSLYGRVSVTREKPRLVGPVRLDWLRCPARGVTLARSAVQVDTTFDRALDGADGRLVLAAGAAALTANRVDGAAGTTRFVWRKGALTAYYDIAGRRLTTARMTVGTVGSAGILRVTGGQLDLRGDVRAGELATGNSVDTALAGYQRAGGESLVAPLLVRARGALRREMPGSRFAGRFVLRQGGGTTSVLIPRATLTGGSGAALLSLSRVQLASGEGRAANLSGNFATGGAGLPQVVGRMERDPAGRLSARLNMAEYAAGSARIAVPRLVITQAVGGALGFVGQARLSGDLPGGRATNLALPIDGDWSAANGLAVGRRCTALAFDALAVANLQLDRRRVLLCPPPGGAIVRADRRGLRIAAGAPSLALSGRLGATPISITSGPIGVAWPGAAAARQLDIALGPAQTASRFRISSLTAQIGKDVAGRFSGSDILLAAIPLDLREAAGEWRYAGGRLSIANAAFRLEDRERDDRFRPLVAQDAELTLFDNAITAGATFREPTSGREVVRAGIRHDLATARGGADLTVAGIVFDRQLQPDTLTRLALGVIANAQGTVRGSGRIAWTPAAIASTGSFSTEGMDFAAAFGPVKGASGTIVFTDLLRLVTAPDQRLKVASVNPGIEVNDGVVSYELRPDMLLHVNRGQWPFMGGALELQPVDMRLGQSEVRRYVLAINGLDAAKFIAQMELGNLSATGVFDGTLPLVFDENGGRIEGGRLLARAPGGNLSYVGALTYKDLSPMANYAFAALRSLDYREMTVAMDGALEGEIVTRVRFRGVKQGAGTKRNFITDRLAKLPLQFNINLRAPFYQLMTSFKAMYDPAYVRDPRALGLIDARGRPIRRETSEQSLPATRSTDVPANIQPPESETVP